MKRSVSAAVVVLLLAAGAGAPARAACDVSATAIGFGSYDVFVPTPLLSTGTITVSCDEVPPPDVTIAVGAGSGGSFNPRQLLQAARPERLNYNVFTTSARTTVWGDGTAGTSTVLLRRVRRNRPPVVTTIYGAVPPGQDVPVGAYADTLTVTITW